jgi:hypothetical protein
MSDNKTYDPVFNWSIPLPTGLTAEARDDREYMSLGVNIEYTPTPKVQPPTAEPVPSHFFFNPKFRGSDRNIGDPSYGFMWQWVLDDIQLMGQRLAQLNHVMQITKGAKPDFAIDFLKDSRIRLKAHKNMLNTFFQRRLDADDDETLAEMLERNLKITDLIKRAIDEDCDYESIQAQLSAIADLTSRKQDAMKPEGDPNRGEI